MPTQSLDIHVKVHQKTLEKWEQRKRREHTVKAPTQAKYRQWESFMHMVAYE